jgi:hypothetical protein
MLLFLFGKLPVMLLILASGLSAFAAFPLDKPAWFLRVTLGVWGESSCGARRGVLGDFLAEVMEGQYRNLWEPPSPQDTASKFCKFLSMQQPTNFIRFDFAIKKYLRNKADYVVLEGFLTSVLGHSVKIQDVTDPEGNQNASDDKFNRVDILAKFESGELAIIEVQTTYELDYFHRMLYGTVQAIHDHFKLGDDYLNIKKVYSINIVYFNIGDGEGFAYHGKTIFHNMENPKDQLFLTKHQKDMFKCEVPGDIYPEYFILRVEEFDQVAKSNLEQWMNFLKKTDIPPTATAPGLKEAREKLLIDRMTPEEYQAYLAHLNSVYFRDNVARSNYLEGEMTGREEGLAEGRAEGARSKAYATARKLKAKGLSVQEIADLVELTVEEVEAL